MKTNSTYLKSAGRAVNELQADQKKSVLPEILFVSTFPPRECGIATYSEDLIGVLESKFHHSFNIKVAAVENEYEKFTYDNDKVEYVLDTSDETSFQRLAAAINSNDNIKIVLIQHEFGLFVKNEAAFITFLEEVKKPVSVVFHTVLPNPNEIFRKNVNEILKRVSSVIVMTKNAEMLLNRDYQIDPEIITVIAHGTHLVNHKDKNELKHKYGFQGREVLSTFGLLGRGKSIETSLKALPAVVKMRPEVLFLIIGRTHPGVVKEEGEAYREMLEQMVADLGLQDNVKFINKYVQLDELLDYLQLTDIYLFTSKDPNQAVSGTFSYALSCGCPIISTPIPHALEVLGDNTGILFDFDDSEQLTEGINKLLYDVKLRKEIIMNGLHKITPTSWENAAVSHAKLFRKLVENAGGMLELHYRTPEISLQHLKKMTTDFGMYQFAKVNHPDVEYGYTLDDNARAMISVSQHYKLTRDKADLLYISTYLNFIEYCQKADGSFLNYIDNARNFTTQNTVDSLSDSNGRAIWSLGYLISLSDIVPQDIIVKAKIIFHKAITQIHVLDSPRSMAFIIKGMYYYNRSEKIAELRDNTKLLADKLVKMYRNEAEENWKWFEGYLTYANSVLPEAILCAYAMTGDSVYRDVALESFDFLLENTFTENEIKVVSNRSWQIKGHKKEEFGEQPIDVAYTILALRKFYDIFKDPMYIEKMETAFNWFLGNNHLSQIIYNPSTGGCYDGLEETCVNLNQGAESTVSYLMSRLTIHKHLNDSDESGTSPFVNLVLKNKKPKTLAAKVS